ncbi:MAG TPA: nucleotide sugar dehydrogenase [Nitrososphaeraceae archaeon]|jgi:nucleotide sugar dehydrogenase
MPSNPNSKVPRDSAPNSIIEQFKNGTLKIGIYGLGHVGSPLAAAWLRAGCSVIAVDTSELVLTAARNGRSLIHEPGIAEAYSEGLKNHRFEVSSDPVDASNKSYFKMICVPVLSKDLSADLNAVISVASSIGKGLKKGDVVSLNPSVPPGTTEKIVIPTIEKASGLSVARDFVMIYNPERIYEGRALQDIENNYPAVISSVGPDSIAISKSIYSMIFGKGILQIGSIQTAEAEKLFEGVYRDVNIALANELAKFSEVTGIDFWEARSAANSQPYCHIHRPGIGVGGACIPVYPKFILGLAERLDVRCDLTKIGRLINDSMPSYCVKQALQLVGGANFSELRVAVLGLAFRGGVSDTRLSPTYAVIKELKKNGVSKIKVHDPFVLEDPNLDKGVTLTNNLVECLSDCDLVIITADHQDYHNLGKSDLESVSIYDGRGILSRGEIHELRYAALGFKNKNTESKP